MFRVGEQEIINISASQLLNNAARGGGGNSKTAVKMISSSKIGSSLDGTPYRKPVK